MDTDIAIRVDGVSKNFTLPHLKKNSVKSVFTGMFQASKGTQETQHALREISFDVKKGDFFGIVGRNGSGKSTLLKLLAEIYQPTKGAIAVNGKLVPFIELGVGFNPELSGRENVYLNGALLGFSKKEIDVQYRDIVEFAELERFMDQKLKNYSSGMQVRLAFSMATRAKTDILLVDEVLAVGDADFQRKCFDYFRTLKKDKKTVVFVSHDMMAIREYCDKAVLIEGGKLVCAGKADKVAAAYTQMFIEQDQSSSKGQQSKRWGDKTALYDKIILSSRKLTAKDAVLHIDVEAEMKRDIQNPVLGFSIKNASGMQICGTNNKIKKQDLPDLAAGDRVRFSWTVPNIFSDGKHYVDIALIYRDGSSVADWWEEAASFTALQEEKTPYVVSPPVELTMSMKEKSRE